MTIKYHNDILQGTEEWFAIRRGLLTASEMKNIITPKKLEIVKDPTHLYELAAQRVSGFVEPTFVSNDMLRGKEDEIIARALYNEHYAPVTECGFITNDRWGFTLGYSPDWLVSDEGQAECKSQCQKYHFESIGAAELDPEFRIQIQTGLLVSERSFCDFVSFCGGLPMWTKKILPDLELQEKIVAAAFAAEEKIKAHIERYNEAMSAQYGRFIPTERRITSNGMIVGDTDVKEAA